jgi:hypothetical protein
MLLLTDHWCCAKPHFQVAWECLRSSFPRRCLHGAVVGGYAPLAGAVVVGESCAVSRRLLRRVGEPDPPACPVHVRPGAWVRRRAKWCHPWCVPGAGLAIGTSACSCVDLRLRRRSAPPLLAGHARLDDDSTGMQVWAAARVEWPTSESAAAHEFPPSRARALRP